MFISNLIHLKYMFIYLLFSYICDSVYINWDIEHIYQINETIYPKPIVKSVRVFYENSLIYERSCKMKMT